MLTIVVSVVGAEKEQNLKNRLFSNDSARPCAANLQMLQNTNCRTKYSVVTSSNLLHTTTKSNLFEKKLPLALPRIGSGRFELSSGTCAAVWQIAQRLAASGFLLVSGRDFLEANSIIQ